MARLLLVRHGQASYGEVDYDRLSTRGKEQARAIGTHLSRSTIDALYSGPLRRQTETAAFAREAAPGLPEPATVAELAEYPGFDMMNQLIPKLVAEDPEAACEVLGGDEVVIDVQTHYVADRDQSTAPHLIEMYRYAMPEWWRGLEGYEAYSFGEYLRCVFVETETAVAVLSSSPGVEEHRQLYNEEMAATRRLLEEFGGRKRLLNHTVVDPTRADDIESMGRWVEDCRPAAWKGLVLGGLRLDDATAVVLFLNRTHRELRRSNLH